MVPLAANAWGEGEYKVKADLLCEPWGVGLMQQVAW